MYEYYRISIVFLLIFVLYAFKQNDNLFIIIYFIVFFYFQVWLSSFSNVNTSERNINNSSNNNNNHSNNSSNDNNKNSSNNNHNNNIQNNSNYSNNHDENEDYMVGYDRDEILHLGRIGLGGEEKVRYVRLYLCLHGCVSECMVE